MAAAEFHQMIAAARIGFARDVRGDVPGQRAVAELVYIFHFGYFILARLRPFPRTARASVPPLPGRVSAAQIRHVRSRNRPPRCPRPAPTTLPCAPRRG